MAMGIMAFLRMGTVDTYVILFVHPGLRNRSLFYTYRAHKTVTNH